MIHGLSFMIFPDAPAAARLTPLALGESALYGLKGRPLREDRFHVSMYGLGGYGETPDHVVDGARRAAEDIEHPVFDVQFESAMSYDNASESRRAYVLVGGEGVEGLERLRTQLEVAVARHLPRLRKPPRFDPHLTLLYDDRLVGEHRVEPIRFTVREFVLIESLQGLTRYNRLGRWRLG